MKGGARRMASAGWLGTMTALAIGLMGGPGEARAEAPRAVFLAGENEYKSEKSLPLLADLLADRHGFETEVIHDANIADNWQPEPGDRINDFPGIERILDADLLVLYIRFRTLPAEQLDVLQQYVDSGKPIVAFRTSTHAFHYHGDDELAEWNQFGAKVLGAPWIRHYGHESSTDVSIIDGQADHPILNGVPEAFHTRSWLYHIRPDYPPESATPLLMGHSTGPSQTPMPEREANPVAWTFTHPGGGRVFTTTLGHPEDFEMEAVRRLALNGMLWAADRPAATYELPAIYRDFELKDGERVLFLGNTFIERDNHHGHIETLLTSNFPGRRLTFRNMGWAGDTVSIQERPLGFGTVEEHVNQFGPTLTFVAYGMGESFSGEAGLPAFESGLNGMLDMLEAAGSRYVLLSPIKHEAHGAPMPDPADHNAKLRMYVEAIREIAVERGAPFIDLYHGVIGSIEQPSAKLTSNGVHLNANGYWRAATAIGRALDLTLPQDTTHPPDSTAYAKLHETILAKNELFFYRWRAHNGEYIYGRRAEAGNGNAGNPQFVQEHAELERLIEEAEARIHELAQTEPKPIDLSQREE